LWALRDPASALDRWTRLLRTSWIDTAQRAFLLAGNLDLQLPLRWEVYGDRYELSSV
jgi:hypothetical protein